MNNNKKNLLKGVFYGFAGTVVCIMLLGTIKPNRDHMETGVNVETGESVLLIPSQHQQPSGGSPSNFNIGRYQLSSWSSNWKDAGTYGAFLIDTTSGRTKIVYSCLFRKNGKKNIIVNNLNKPFGGISP
ncbi:MAG: hypothetical protein D3924_00720 [Candidatus Electrothrix sp. AR4]|nr:hypothetical protein [Candidatus Electrothrix sp. AR4]